MPRCHTHRWTVSAVALLCLHTCVLAQTPDHAHIKSIETLLARPGNVIGEGTVFSADGLAQDGDGRGTAAAVDGDPDTYRDEVNAQPLYRLAVKFDKPRAIATIGIAGWAQHDYAAKDFEVVVDGRSVHTVKNAAYDHNVLLIDLPPTSGCIFELWITAYYGGSPAIRELTMYETRDAAAKAQPPKPAWHWEMADDSFALLGPNGVVWKLNHGPDLNKVYFHPLSTVDGKLLTWNSPPDHVWHHGLWFSWKKINGLNYWEIDRRTGKPAGKTRLLDVEVLKSGQDGAELKLTFAFHPAGKPDDVVLDETVLLEIETPRPDGAYRIDWLQETTARVDAVFDRTPPPGQPGGKGHGGYGGLSLRGAKDLDRTLMIDSSGRRDMEIHRQYARWMDTSGVIGKDHAGVTFMDHPGNPRHPVPWFVVKNRLKHGPFTYMNPAILCRQPLTLKKGETLRQFYRVLIHPGPAYASLLEEEFERFAAVAPPTPAKGKLYVEPVLPPPGASDWSQTHENMATPKLGAFAYASSTYGAAYVADKAIDGKWTHPETDAWMASAVNPPHFIRLDLGEVRTIDRVRIIHKALREAASPAASSDFHVQASRKPWGPWQDLVAPVRGNRAVVTEHVFKPTQARYVRLLIEAAEQSGNARARIYELEVFAPKQ